MYGAAEGGTIHANKYVVVCRAAFGGTAYTREDLYYATGLRPVAIRAGPAALRIQNKHNPVDISLVAGLRPAESIG